MRQAGTFLNFVRLLIATVVLVPIFVVGGYLGYYFITHMIAEQHKLDLEQKTHPVTNNRPLPEH